MDADQLEQFIGDLWSRNGWETTVSRKTRDKSLDVLAEKETPYHQRHAIQAKRYQAGNNVGGPKISEYASLRDQFDADAAVVVTTSGFTKDAEERAETLNVKLIDGDRLVQMVAQADAIDLVSKYSDLSRAQPSETNTQSASNPIAKDQYFWIGITVLSAIPWTIIVLVMSILDAPIGSTLSRTLMVIGLLPMTGTVIGLSQDLTLIRDSQVPWTPDAKWWLIGAILAPYLTIPFYVVRRYSAIS